MSQPAPPAAPPSPLTPAWLGRLRAHLRVPLFRNAYALIGSTFLMTGLGVVASFAAARLYPAEDFGRGQSAVHALILLSGLGNLRLMNVLTRFLPRAGTRARWLVGRCYLLAALASAVVCTVYLVALRGALPVEELMGDTPRAGLWLSGAVVAFALFTVQDAVLTGLRQAGWVPLKNGLHGLAKLGLVVALAGVAPASGILASWAVPSVLALVPVGLLISRRLLPAAERRPVQPEDLSWRRLAPFAAGEYGGALCELAVANLIPLVILAQLGPEEAGYFAVAWLIGTTLDHIVVHFGASLTVEGAADPARLPALTRDLLRRSATIVGPIAAVVVLGAPVLLLPFGPEFAAEASGVLRLLGLSLLPRLVCIVAVVVARVRSQVPWVLGIQALLAAGTLGGSVALLGPLGIAGPGLAYLAASVGVAALVAPRVFDLRRTRAALSFLRARRGWLQVVPLVAAGLLFGVSLLQIDRTDPGGSLGLAAVLPATWWSGAVVLTVGFTWVLLGYRPTGTGPGPATGPIRWLLLAHLVALVVLLHGTPGLIETHARFPTAWTHVGFVDHIVETGSVDPGYDARYNWPGSFGFGAFLTELTGADTARALLRFAPVVVNLLLLAPLAALVGHFTRDRGLRWMALWLFVVTNWIGQDYLAPQPLALLSYLTAVAVLLRWFRRIDLAAGSRLDLVSRLARRWPGLMRDDRLDRALAPRPTIAASTRFVLTVAVTAIGLALSFSHQLTPLMLVLAALLLVVAGRMERPRVVAILAVCAVAWATLGTAPFLQGNLENLVAALGNVGGVVEDNQQRVGADPARQLVLAIRLAVLAMVAGLAAVGLARQWRARRTDWALAGLAVAPAALVGLNSYGGEILLRISLFALPFLALLAAFAFRREHGSPGRLHRAGAAFLVVAITLLPLFVVARYGNEAYERTYSEDVAAWDFVVDRAPPGAGVVVPDFAGPWRYRRLTHLDIRLFADEVARPVTTARLDRLVASSPRPTYLVLGTASARFRTIAEGYPEDWQGPLATDLLATGRYRVVYEAGGARVLEYDGPPESELRPEPAAAGGPVRRLPILGAVLAVLMVLNLLAREAATSGLLRWLRRPALLDLMAVVAAVAFAAVVALHLVT